MLKKKSFGYIPIKGPLSASSSDFYGKSLNSRQNSTIGFSPKKDAVISSDRNSLGITSKRIIKNNPSMSTSKILNVNYNRIIIFYCLF